jgi:threonylcarbamoyladenosine tRNA methylthiotransferase CDKAL1
MYNVLIARGCLGNCSYCAIRRAHGTLKSTPMEEVLGMFRDGLNRGYKSFVLIAEDTGAYGVDLGITFPELLKNVFELSPDFKLLLNDINPQWLIRYLNQLLPLLEKYQDRIIDIRMPVQSGSNDILKKMRRPYSIEKVQECIDELYKTIPNLKIITHIIVGFPGETDDDFLKTINFLKKNRLTQTSVLKYDDRSFSDSFKLPGKVSRKVITQRRNLLKKEGF